VLILFDDGVKRVSDLAWYSGPNLWEARGKVTTLEGH